MRRQQPAPGGQVLNEVAAAAAAPLLPPLGAKIQEHDRAAAAPCLACCVQLRQQTYRRELQVQLIAAPRLALASSTAWQPTLSAHMRRRPRTWPQRDRPQVGRHPYPQQCAGLHFNGCRPATCICVPSLNTKTVPGITTGVSRPKPISHRNTRISHGGGEASGAL